MNAARISAGSLRRELAARQEAFRARVEGRAANRRSLHAEAEERAEAAQLRAEAEAAEERENSQIQGAVLELESAMAAAIAASLGSARVKLLTRQIALVLLAARFGAEVAADALSTLPESVKTARAVVGPIVAAGALPVTPDVESFTTILKAALGPGERRRKAELIGLVAAAFGVAVADIVSDRRTAAVVRPRAAAMFLCKRLTPSSYPDIGRAFCGRDHTTILHAVRKVERIVAETGIDGGDAPEAWAALLAALPPESWRGRP